MQHFTEALNLTKYTLYMQDYGGPIGFRMVLAHPERVESLIVQEAVAHNEGLGAGIGRPGVPFWADRAQMQAALRWHFRPGHDSGTAIRAATRTPSDTTPISKWTNMHS